MENLAILMKALLLLFIGSICFNTSNGQKRDTWYSFLNKDSSKVGFKDQHGVVKIEPKFATAFSPNKFDDIISTLEDSKSVIYGYYLTKSGRVIGRDSMYLWDLTADCESEGFIRFHDRKTDQLGMFNRNGRVAIPAIYNDLTEVRNGLIVALKGAERFYEGEHYSWAGGSGFLIDTNNNILVDQFNSDFTNLNFKSLLISDKATTDTIRQNFLGVNGKQYSFIDYDKEFRKWVKSSLLINLSSKSLLNDSYSTITYWNDSEWVHEVKQTFLDRNFELIKEKLLRLQSIDCNYFISRDEMNEYIYDAEEFQVYFNNCNRPINWKYPLMSIVINYKDKESTQDSFDFLRTDNGYKLISVSIRNGKLRYR